MNIDQAEKQKNNCRKCKKVNKLLKSLRKIDVVVLEIGQNSVSSKYGIICLDEFVK